MDPRDLNGMSGVRGSPRKTGIKVDLGLCASGYNVAR